MRARSSWDLLQEGRGGGGASARRGRLGAAAEAAGTGSRPGRRPVTEADFRWSWYLPAARSSLVRSFRTRYWSAALLTPTDTTVRGLAFSSRHSRLVQ